MAAILSAEDQSRIAVIRAKHEAGTASQDDLKEFIRTLRQGRISALATSDAAKRKLAKAAIPSADDLLNELEGL